MANEKAIDTLTFEEAYAELQALVETLENEQRPLEESMRIYERGQALIKHCGVLLEKAQLQVSKIEGEQITAFNEE
jgi:exodeoxyribonuclease VII small subunit